MVLLTSDEAQEELGISRPTLYLWVKQGKLHPRQLQPQLTQCYHERACA